MSAAAALPTPPAARLDRQRVERWTAAIGAGDEAAVRSDFAAIGARGPAIVWRPPVDRPSAPQLRFLLRYWLDLRGLRAMPLASEIDALEMRPALGYIMLVEPEDRGRDFRYRLYGSIRLSSKFRLVNLQVEPLEALAPGDEFAFADCHGHGTAALPLASKCLGIPITRRRGGASRRSAST